MNDKNLRVVLLSCCAPCSAGAIKQLADGKIPNVSDFIVLFYNPNIFPEREYTKRMQEQIKYCESLGVKYAVLEYDHDAWRDAVRGFETAPERGERCSLCFEYRFRRAVKFAHENSKFLPRNTTRFPLFPQKKTIIYILQKRLRIFSS